MCFSKEATIGNVQRTDCESCLQVHEDTPVPSQGRTVGNSKAMGRLSFTVLGKQITPPSCIFIFPSVSRKSSLGFLLWEWPFLSVSLAIPSFFMTPVLRKAMVSGPRELLYLLFLSGCLFKSCDFIYFSYDFYLFLSPTFSLPSSLRSLLQNTSILMTPQYNVFKNQTLLFSRSLCPFMCL